MFKFDRILRISDARTETWKMDDFLQKLTKVVRIVLYRLAISQSDIPSRDKPPGHESKGAKTFRPGQSLCT